MNLCNQYLDILYINNIYSSLQHSGSLNTDAVNLTFVYFHILFSVCHLVKQCLTSYRKRLEYIDFIGLNISYHICITKRSLATMTLVKTYIKYFRTSELWCISDADRIFPRPVLNKWLLTFKSTLAPLCPAWCRRIETEFIIYLSTMRTFSCFHHIERKILLWQFILFP